MQMPVSQGVAAAQHASGLKRPVLEFGRTDCGFGQNEIGGDIRPATSVFLAGPGGLRNF